ncbi:unnamed protein product [Arctogadus glacialis]
MTHCQTLSPAYPGITKPFLELQAGEAGRSLHGRAPLEAVAVSQRQRHVNQGHGLMDVLLTGRSALFTVPWPPNPEQRFQMFALAVRCPTV